MSKKRVHEIAKELKDSGVELDNKQVVDELKALGYDVKSHSSSLEDDEAKEAVKRILDKKKPKAAPAPVLLSKPRRPFRKESRPPGRQLAACSEQLPAP